MTFHGKLVLLSGIVLLASCQSARQHPQDQAYVPDDDMCGASQFQSFIGKPLTSIENMRFGTESRAIAYNSVVSMDFNLRRLNFMADAQGNITRIYCG
mgnify:FL=1